MFIKDQPHTLKPCSKCIKGPYCRSLQPAVVDMEYENILNTFPSDPSFHIEAPSYHPGLFTALRAIDDVQFRTALDEFFDNLPVYGVADTGPPVSDTQTQDPGLSMGHFGELTVPELFVSHEPCNNSLNPYLDCLHSVGPVPYIVPQDQFVPLDHESSYIGYNNWSLYSTDWEPNVHLHSNSQIPFTGNHIDIGMSHHCGIPESDVMQRYQELDNLSASGYHQYSALPPQVVSYPSSQYTQVPQETQPNTCEYPSLLLELVPALSSCPTPDMTSNSWPNSVSFFHPSYLSNSDSSFPLSPIIPRDTPPSSSSGSSSPASSILQTPPQSQISRETLAASPPNSDIAYTTSNPPPSLPQTKKKVRKSKKMGFIPGQVLKKGKGRREKPDGRAPIQSQRWLDIYFPNNKGPCTLCGGGPANARADRALEHLVSSHIFQIVKKLGSTYDAEALHEIEQPHFIQTEAQFTFARDYVHVVGCSLCSSTTSLVVRETNIQHHLDAVHGDLPQSIRDKERDRVRALTRNRDTFYSFHDEFLYKFALV